MLRGNDARRDGVLAGFYGRAERPIWSRCSRAMPGPIRMGRYESAGARPIPSRAFTAGIVRASRLVFSLPAALAGNETDSPAQTTKVCQIRQHKQQRFAP